MQKTYKVHICQNASDIKCIYLQLNNNFNFLSSHTLFLEHYYSYKLKPKLNRKPLSSQIKI